LAHYHNGGCACGAVRYSFSGGSDFVASCHCADCKRASGGEAAIFVGVADTDFAISEGEPQAFHYVAESGRGLDRNFCAACGSRLFTSSLEALPGTILVQIGSLDYPEAFEPTVEMFTRQRLSWVKKLEAAQFAAMLEL
jgi:hypothetical protein